MAKKTFKKGIPQQVVLVGIVSTFISPLTDVEVEESAFSQAVDTEGKKALYLTCSEPQLFRVKADKVGDATGQLLNKAWGL